MILYFGVTLGFLLWEKPLLDELAEKREWNGSYLFAGLLVAYVLVLAVCFVRFAKELSQKRSVGVMGWPQAVWMMVNSVYLFAAMEFVTNQEFEDMVWYYGLLNIGVICVFCILMSLIFNSIKRAMIFMNIFYFCMSLVFYYVYLFRGEAFQLIDLYSLGTAAEVIGGYHFQLTAQIVAAAVGMLLIVRLWMSDRDYCFVQRQIKYKILVRLVAVALTIGGYLAYMNLNWNAQFGIISDLWNPAKTYREYGTTVGFLAVAKYMRLTPPDGYSEEEVQQISEQSCSINEGKELKMGNAGNVTPVNIIAIMNESWFDYRSVGDPMTSESYMPFLDSLNENIIKGYTLTCTKGGGTAKTEYEFLTGNSCKRFPGMVPYVSYFTHDQYSIVTTLQDQGYQAIAMHPNKATNWKRTTAYRFLNFDDFIAIDQFDSSTERYRNMISDQANYEKIIEVYEQKEKGTPLFLFDITMQNHSGYTNKYFQADVNCEGYDCDEADQYFSLLKISDEAIEYLIEYFEQVEEPTMIVMFGDHSPKLPDEFETWIAGDEYKNLSLEEQEKFYGTPFFIWTNYEMESEENVWISTNYLSSYMLSLTGLELTPYNEYLLSLREEMPALNHLGFLSEDGNWYSWSEAGKEELELERQYECLQYNELMDRNDRIDEFFLIENNE
ncbi:MAG: LTA synthase family protein [Fusicatenibacter sp.]